MWWLILFFGITSAQVVTKDRVVEGGQSFLTYNITVPESNRPTLGSELRAAYLVNANMSDVRYYIYVQTSGTNNQAVEALRLARLSYPNVISAVAYVDNQQRSGYVYKFHQETRKLSNVHAAEDVFTKYFADNHLVNSKVNWTEHVSKFLQTELYVYITMDDEPFFPPAGFDNDIGVSNIDTYIGPNVNIDGKYRQTKQVYLFASDKSVYVIGYS